MYSLSRFSQNGGHLWKRDDSSYPDGEYKEVESNEPHFVFSSGLGNIKCRGSDILMWCQNDYPSNPPSNHFLLRLISIYTQWCHIHSPYRSRDSTINTWGLQETKLTSPSCFKTKLSCCKTRTCFQLKSICVNRWNLISPGHQCLGNYSLNRKLENPIFAAFEILRWHVAKLCIKL